MSKAPLVRAELRVTPAAAAASGGAASPALIVGTDSTWRARQSSTVHAGGWVSGDYGGDSLDHTADLPGWATPAVNESGPGWEAATEYALAREILPQVRRGASVSAFYAWGLLPLPFHLLHSASSRRSPSAPPSPHPPCNPAPPARPPPAASSSRWPSSSRAGCRSRPSMHLLAPASRSTWVPAPQEDHACLPSPVATRSVASPLQVSTVNGTASEFGMVDYVRLAAPGDGFQQQFSYHGWCCGGGGALC